MEVETQYGIFTVSETATGIMAEKIDTGVQLFIDGKWLHTLDSRTDLSLLILTIEDEYEFQHS